MPVAGDSFTVEILKAHIKWGELPPRKSPTRQQREGESYIKIPAKYAKKFNIFNENKTDANALYSVTCVNGDQIKGNLLAQGCAKAGKIYAKQFSVQDDLKAMGDWYRSVGAQVGGHVKVTFTSSSSLAIEYLKPVK